MLSRQVLVKVFAVAVLLAGVSGQEAVQAGEKRAVRVAGAQDPDHEAEKEVAALPPEAIKAALKGFRGLLVGEIVGKTETGIVLRAGSIALLKGCRAPNPALAIGQTTPVLYDTVVANEGDEVPNGRLIESIARIETIPTFAFGGFDGEQAAGKLVVDWGEERGVRWATHMLWLGKKEPNDDVRRRAEAVGAAVLADERIRKELQAAKFTEEQAEKARGVMVRIVFAMRRGEDVLMHPRLRDHLENNMGLNPEQIGVVAAISKRMAKLEVDGAGPRGPIVTVRVLSNDNGDLVMDRVLPGAQTFATWDSMDKVQLHFGGGGDKKEDRKAEPARKGADF